MYVEKNIERLAVILILRSEWIQDVNRWNKGVNNYSNFLKRILVSIETAMSYLLISNQTYHRTI